MKCHVLYTLRPRQYKYKAVKLANGAGNEELGKQDKMHKKNACLHVVPRSQNEWSYTSTLPIRLRGVVLS
jgi:hypothetical protein